MASWKPGSEADQAKNVGGQGDFGVPVGSGPSRDRDYVTENTKMSDPGAAKPRSGEQDGVRTSGAGWTADGDGAGSGGDVDTDILGLGTGGGIAATGPDGAPGPDDSDGTAREFASGAPTRNWKGPKAGKVEGSVMSPTDGIAAAPSNQGSDAVTNPAARGDDSFAAEISGGEATGQDLAVSPSSDTQGLSTEDNQIDGQKDMGRKDTEGFDTDTGT
jgi:hypothetical protein